MSHLIERDPALLIARDLIKEMARPIKRLVARVPVFVWVIVALAVVFPLIRFGYTQGWTGFEAYTDPKGDYHPAKTLWDWMGLFADFLVPLLIAYFGLRLSLQQGQIADDRNRETALQDYLDKMSELLLKEQLANPEAPPAVRNIARARTVTTLRQLDSIRRNLLLGFLREAGLSSKNDPVRILSDAMLKDADLSHAYLYETDLAKTSLSGADLARAFLFEADLSNASLIATNLSRALLNYANLSQADLSHANLREAVLQNANLSKADLSRADLSEAILRGADLSMANLNEANLHWTYYDRNTLWPKGFTPPPEAIKSEIVIEKQP